MIYGVFLPKDVLAKIYYKNAEQILYFGTEKPAGASAEHAKTLKSRPDAAASRAAVTAKPLSREDS